jgi:hypothetical protein
MLCFSVASRNYTGKKKRSAAGLEQNYREDSSSVFCSDRKWEKERFEATFFFY